MAVPVVFRVLPFGADLAADIEGPTSGGNLVQIFGDGFRLGTDDTPTVEVLFDTAPAIRVDVIRTNALHVIAPPSPLIGISGGAVTSPEGLVDITIRNLDDSGVPIPGEELVLPDAYNYKRPGVTGGDFSTLRHVISTLILAMRRDIIDNVLISEHTEYDADTADGFNITEIAKFPAVVLVGPDTPKNEFFSERSLREDVQPDGSFLLRRPPVTVDLLFDVVVIDDSEMRSLAIQEAVRDFFNANEFLVVDRDPSDPSKGTVSYEMNENSDEFIKQSRPNTSNVRSYSGSIIIRGVDIEGPPGFENATRSAATAPELTSDPEVDIETA